MDCLAREFSEGSSERSGNLVDGESSFSSSEIRPLLDDASDSESSSDDDEEEEEELGFCGVGSNLGRPIFVDVSPAFGNVGDEPSESSSEEDDEEEDTSLRFLFLFLRLVLGRLFVDGGAIVGDEKPTSKQKSKFRVSVDHQSNGKPSTLGYHCNAPAPSKSSGSAFLK